MLLEKRNQKVDGQVNVLNQLIFIHGQISDGNAQAQYLEKNVQFFEDGINKGGLSEHRSHRIEKIESTFWFTHDKTLKSSCHAKKEGTHEIRDVYYLII